MKILWSKTFLKLLKTFGSVSKKEICSLLQRHPHSVNLISIDKKQDNEILKGYLLGKKVRIIIYFELIKNTMIPVLLIKKESKYGKNIRKDNYKEKFSTSLLKTLVDIENNNYEEENL